MNAAPFPHAYEVDLRRGPEGAVALAGVREPIAGGPPPEFGGTEDRWSPEHLLLGALTLCLSTTFDALAKRAGLAALGFQVHGHATLDKTAQGLAFTGFTLTAQVQVAAADVARAGELLAKAKKHCLVGNALCAPVELRAEVIAAG